MVKHPKEKGRKGKQRMKQRETWSDVPWRLSSTACAAGMSKQGERTTWGQQGQENKQEHGSQGEFVNAQDLIGPLDI